MIEVGFFDGHCPECDRPIGWFGTVADNPGCGCDWQPDAGKLVKLEEQIEAEIEAMFKEADDEP